MWHLYALYQQNIPCIIKWIVCGMRPHFTNKETNKEKLYYEVFDKYTKYINEVGWIGCEERELWRRMRGGNFNRCHKLRPYIKEKLKHIHDFSRFLKKYEKILPDI